jgi:very-long-chain enoyl-CoA reductase
VNVELELPDTATVADLKKEVAKRFSQYPPDRQWYTVDGADDKGKKKALKDDKFRLSEYGITNGSGLTFKDLGPQIGYRTTFIIEYLGPLIFFPIFFYFSNVIYGTAKSHNYTQTVALWLCVLHFVKRELESVLVHRFSHGTMPVMSCVRNCMHYWVLCGLMVGYFVLNPTQSETWAADQIHVIAGVWAIAELGNLYVHIYLRNLRPPNSQVRKIPRGFLFDLVSCPNYFFEVTAWIAFSLIVNHWAAWLFTVVGAAQMAQWADKKHRQYKQDFAEYPRGRKRMFPFVW